MLRAAPQKSHCPPPKPGRFGCSHGEIKQKKTHLIAKAALYQVKATPRQNRAQSKLVPWRGQRHSHQLPGNEEKKGSFLPKKRRVRVPRLLFKGFSHSPSQLGKIRLGGMGVGPALPPPPGTPRRWSPPPNNCRFPPKYPPRSLVVPCKVTPKPCATLKCHPQKCATLRCHPKVPPLKCQP